VSLSSYNGAALTANNTYTYTVYAVNGAGVGAGVAACLVTASVSTYTLASTAGITVTYNGAAGSTTSVGIDYLVNTASSACTSVAILDSNGNTLTSISSFSPTTQTITLSTYNGTSLTTNTNYVLKVYALNQQGYGAVPAALVATINAWTLADPTTATVAYNAAGSTTTAVSLSYTGSNSGYSTLAIRDPNNNSVATPAYSASSTVSLSSYNGAALTANNTYTYAVYAVNGAGVGAGVVACLVTASVSTYTLASTAGITVTYNGAAGSTTSVGINYLVNTASSACTSVAIVDSNNNILTSISSFPSTTQTITLSTYNGASLTTNTNYVLKVYAFNPQGYGIVSAALVATINAWTLADPNSTTVAYNPAGSTTTAVSLSYTGSNNGYSTLAIRDPYNNSVATPAYSASSTVSINRYNAVVLTTNTQYSYSVYVVNGVGVGYGVSACLVTSSLNTCTLANTAGISVTYNSSLSSTSAVGINYLITAATFCTSLAIVDGQGNTLTTLGSLTTSYQTTTITSFNGSGLTANKSYALKVYALNQLGYGVYAACLATTVTTYTLADPTQATVSYNGSGSTISTVSITYVGSNNGYSKLVILDSNNNNVATVNYSTSSNSASISTYNGTTLTQNTQYTYSVYVVNTNNYGSGVSSCLVASVTTCTWVDATKLTVSPSSLTPTSGTITVAGTSYSGIYVTYTPTGGSPSSDQFFSTSSFSQNFTGLTANSVVFTLSPANALNYYSTSNNTTYTLTLPVPTTFSVPPSTTWGSTIYTTSNSTYSTILFINANASITFGQNFTADIFVVTGGGGGGAGVRPNSSTVQVPGGGGGGGTCVLVNATFAAGTNTNFLIGNGGAGSDSSFLVNYANYGGQTAVYSTVSGKNNIAINAFPASDSVFNYANQGYNGNYTTSGQGGTNGVYYYTTTVAGVTINSNSLLSASSSRQNYSSGGVSNGGGGGAGAYGAGANGSGGGVGGAGGSGCTASSNGTFSNMLSSTVANSYVFGGGGGGGGNTGNGGSGFNGAGAGGSGEGDVGKNALVNTGCGGGGGGANTTSTSGTFTNGGKGGTGLVILAFTTPLT